MNNITVKKYKLREKLVTNRGAHRAIFEEAVEGYRKESVKLLEDVLTRIKTGTMTRISVSLPLPEDHTSDYDRVIAMLDMDVEDEVILSENDFSMYVMDEWRWRDAFLTANANYSKTAFVALNQ